MTKILLVEDDKSLREIYGVRLLAEGYDIVSAGDGEEALAMAIKDRPDLIISDVMMPKISGFDMLDILRSTTETRNIKVIMMTALSSEDQRARGEQLGADRYLVKSQVGIEDVVQTVHDVLGDSLQLTGANSFVSSPNQRPNAPYVPERSGPAPAQSVAQPSQPLVQQPVYQTPQPQPQPQPFSIASQQQPAPTFIQAPSPTQSPTPAPTTLPQPTAPFSTARPAGFGIGDRVINPLPREEATGPDIASRLNQELGSHQDVPLAAPIQAPSVPQLVSQATSQTDFQQPTAQPTPAQSTQETFQTPSLPTPPPAPVQPSAPEASPFEFEETPRPPQTEATASTNPFLTPPTPPSA